MKRKETDAGKRGGNSKTENVEGNMEGKRERKGEGNGERNGGCLLRRENGGGKGTRKRCCARVCEKVEGKGEKKWGKVKLGWTRKNYGHFDDAREHLLTRYPTTKKVADTTTQTHKNETRKLTHP